MTLLDHSRDSHINRFKLYLYLLLRQKPIVLFEEITIVAK